MLIIGVTGSFGSGKSTVAQMFKKRGAVVFDADGMVHQLLKENKACQKQIIKILGDEVAGKNGIDRRKVAEIVFRDKTALKRIEKLLHPLVWGETVKTIRRAKRSGSKVVVVDAPLLLEAGWRPAMDRVIVVKAHRETQIDRVCRGMGLKREDVLARIRRQMPLKEKLKYADYVVDNDGTKSDTDKQIAKIWKQLIQ